VEPTLGRADWFVHCCRVISSLRIGVSFYSYLQFCATFVYGSSDMLPVRIRGWTILEQFGQSYFRVTESLEASSRPNQTVMNANHWERSECTQHRSVHGMETSLGSRTMATNSGSGYAPSWGLPLYMTIWWFVWWAQVVWAVGTAGWAKYPVRQWYGACRHCIVLSTQKGART